MAGKKTRKSCQEIILPFLANGKLLKNENKMKESFLINQVMLCRLPNTLQNTAATVPRDFTEQLSKNLGKFLATHPW